MSARENESGSVMPGAVRQRQPRPVAFYLVLLALSVAIPLVGLAFYFIHRVAEAERDATRSALLSSARSLSAAVDQEIDKHIAITSTLAQSQALLNGDWTEFTKEGKNSLAFLPGSWLSVIDPNGQILLNTSAPPGTVLPRRPLFDYEKLALTTRQPQVSDIVKAVVARRNAAAAAIPVFHLIKSLQFHPERL